jgi:hypothetical protein
MIVTIDWVNWSTACAMKTNNQPLGRYEYSVLLEHIRTNGIKFCGYKHQDNDFNTVPVVNGTPLTCSFRGWGGVMADAYRMKDDLAYCIWAWGAPDGEVETLPKGKVNEGNKISS